MKKQNWKKVISLVAGSLIIALVISILPGGFLVNAAEVRTAAKAERIALAKIEEELNENIDKDIVKVTVNEDNLDDEDNPYYTVLVETEDDKYGAKVYSKTGEVEVKTEEAIRAERDVKSENSIEFDNFEKFEEYIIIKNKKNEPNFIDVEDYEDYGDKPTDQASLNQLIRDGKKAAISDFKEAEDKVEGKEAFNYAKTTLKEFKSDAKAEIKNIPPKKDDSDIKKLVDKKIISEKQALFIAIKAARINNSKKLDDLKKLEVVLDKDNNPTSYKIEFEYNDISYKIQIDANTGAILGSSNKPLKNVKVKDKNDDKVEDRDDEEVVESEVDGNNNGNGNSKVKEDKNDKKNN